MAAMAAAETPRDPKPSARPATAPRRRTSSRVKPASDEWNDGRRPALILCPGDLLRALGRPCALDNRQENEMAAPKREALPEQARRSSQPWIHQRSQEIQSFGTVRQFPLGLSYNARLLSC